MNTDQFFVIDFRDMLNDVKESELRSLLHDVDGQNVDRFIDKVRHHLSSFDAHQHARIDILDAKDQIRWFKSLKKKSEKAASYLTKLIEFLDDAPMELRQKARRLDSPIDEVQTHLTNLILVINDLEPSKYREQPELIILIKDIGHAFHLELEVKPILRSFSIATDTSFENLPLNSVTYP